MPGSLSKIYWSHLPSFKHMDCNMKRGCLTGSFYFILLCSVCTLFSIVLLCFWSVQSVGYLSWVDHFGWDIYGRALWEARFSYKRKFWIPVKCVNHTHEMLRDAKEKAQKVEDGPHCAISWMFRKIRSVPTRIHSEESESGCQFGPTEHWRP